MSTKDMNITNEGSFLNALWGNFLGNAPRWYKITMASFLVANILLLFILPENGMGLENFNRFVLGWIILLQFIFTLAMALKAYPLGPAGILALQGIALGLTIPYGNAAFAEMFHLSSATNPLELLEIGTEVVYHEILENIPVILLLMFMVAGIYFMKDGLLYVFSFLLVKVRSKILLSLIFLSVAAVLSAFLDALTVTAVIIAVGIGFYSVYHKYSSSIHAKYSVNSDDDVHEHAREELEEFRAFLRNLLMHGAVGTALGGALTLVGEPQNIIIADKMGWSFMEYIYHMDIVALPVFISGITVTVLVEKFNLFGYGADLPDNVHRILAESAKEKDANRTLSDKGKLVIMLVVGVLLVLGLALHVAQVGIIGLAIIILLTTFNGVIDEHQIGKAFQEALPFTALLVVFFIIVSIINSQGLFLPIMDYVFSLDGRAQVSSFFIFNGLLSIISDNVFVATIYITQALDAFNAGLVDRKQLEHIAVAINMGTNIPSVATPNGQAAFLFLLTSALAPLIRLSYFQMMKLAFPYFVVISIMGYYATVYFY